MSASVCDEVLGLVSVGLQHDCVCVCVCIREPQTYVPSCLMYDFQLSLNS